MRIPLVVGLVYIAAHALDDGETEVASGKRFPNATKAVQKTPDGCTFPDPAHYSEDFAADLPWEQAECEAHAQMLTAAKVFNTAIIYPAWKEKPSWCLAATNDRIINSDPERMHAERAHSPKVEVEGASHSVYKSHPKEVARKAQP